MLAIRMQRTGRKGHAMFRVVVQDARRTPTSGKVVAQLGHYDPHTKSITVAKDKAAFYLEHGAQPSPRVAQLLKAEGVMLPDWVEAAAKKSSAIRNPAKLRKNRPAEPVSAEPLPPTDATEPVTAEEPVEAPAEAKTENLTKELKNSGTATLESA